MKLKVGILLAIVLGVFACTHEPILDNGTTPYTLEIPSPLPQNPVIPADNPLTVEGIELGRHLFYEELLSGNNTMSCASCHSPQAAFTDDGNQFSTGIDGIQGKRNSMALINLVFDNFYFWDGRSATLEDQILEPVRDPVEMHDTWPNAVSKIKSLTKYQHMFQTAYGTQDFDSTHVAKAIASFLRTMISSDSDLDKFLRFEGALSPQAVLGFQLWELEAGDASQIFVDPITGDTVSGQGGADCFHCHPTTDGLLTDGQLHNNGLDSVFVDLGAGAVTGNPGLNGKFKTPTLKNIALTAPYMHDGRFQTLEEVIDHYNSGGHFSPTVDPFMKFTDPSETMNLDPQKKAALLELLHSFTDMEFVNNPAFQDPDL